MKIITVLIIVLSLSSCVTLNKHMSFKQLMESRSDSAKNIGQKGNLYTCKNGNNKQVGKISLRNNQWGSYKLKNDSLQLCTYYNANNQQFAWHWQVPNNARGVIAYPSLLIGRSAWGGEHKKINSFPIRVDSIQTLNSVFKTEMYVKHKKYNLAFDLWLTNIPYSTGKNITHEIMIWEDYFDFTPFGKKTATIQTPFGEYNVFVGDLNKPEINLNWKYIAFVRTKKRDSGKVDLKYLLDYLLFNNLIDKKLYLSSVEFGNEIGNSSGFTLVKQFDLELKQVKP